MDKLMITGSTSMIGRAISDYIIKPKGIKNNTIIQYCPHRDVDLTDMSQTSSQFYRCTPDYVISLAGFNGGIKLNQEIPAEIYFKNSQMALNILLCAQYHGVKKLVYVMPSCSYPNLQDYDLEEIKMYEEDYWDGVPHPSVECHGLAKSHFLEFSRQLYKQYKFISVGVCLNTVYGPYDKFNENSKVVGNLIKKIVEGYRENLPHVEIWGSGSPKRGFIYVEDVARAIVEVLKKYDDPMEIINIESEEISIKDLAYLISKIVGYKGVLLFNTDKPDGQMRKMLDFSKSRRLLDYRPEFSLEQGLQKTIEWYKEHYE